MRNGSNTFPAKFWVIGAAVLLAIGVAGSLLIANVVAHNDRRNSQRRFASTSADISAHLGLAIQHEEDLVLSTSALMVTDRRLSEHTFALWLRANQVAARYPEVLSVDRIVVASGSRHCVADLAGLLRAHAAPEAAGFDYCAGSAGQGLLYARDANVGAYRSVPFGTTTALVVQTPLYRGESVPASVAARRAAFVGWASVAFTPKIVLDATLRLHPGTAITTRFGGASPIVFSGGTAPVNGQGATFELGGGWSVTTAGQLNDGSVFTNRNALTVLAGGVALSFLLALLGAVLGTGRARAFRLVRRQTVELNDQTAALRTTLADLEAAQAVKDEFLGLVSHELRTPLTSIKGYTELLQENELGSDVQRYVDVIERNADRLQGLVEDVLLMAQIQNGGLPLQIGEVFLNDLLRRAGEAAGPHAAGKEISIDIDTQPGIATRGDRIRLEQAVDNLVSNAIKYTPKRGEVGIRMTRAGETATIEIADTGIGIPTFEQGQMFERFFRTSNARASGIEGTGLGLAITREIIRAHGGTISFESVEGAGTTFRITLPHAHAAGLESAA